MKYTFKMLENENWWGGTDANGIRMPFNAASDCKNNFKEDAPNETMPFFVSDMGRYIWGSKIFEVAIKDGVFYIDCDGDVVLETAGDSLKSAFCAARKKYFPLHKKKLNRDFFKTVQYNTWIECLYNPTQEHVLRYAKAITDNGFEPGILMIDEGWHGRYGNWTFDRYKFPDPKKMVDELHEMGFKILLWVVPCVCPDGEFFINNLNFSNKNHEDGHRLFIRRKDNDRAPAIIDWWNGYSAILNLANAADREFFTSQLNTLMEDYGIDGFKFDGGAVDMYASALKDGCAGGLSAADLNRAWNSLAEAYEYHEYKDSCNCAGFATIQRLSDRSHSWNKSGINTLIPNSIAQGLIGHPFICPDLVGGGEWSCFTDGKPIDGELFVRWAQCSALFPMMQYSKAPWTCLSENDCKLVIAAGKLHKAFTDEIISLVDEAEITGEPILRSLEYNYPHSGYISITDEFMLGENVLVAPVITAKTYSRKVVVPEGCWVADDGKEYTAGEYEIACPINRLIWFRKK